MHIETVVMLVTHDDFNANSCLMPQISFSLYILSAGKSWGLLKIIYINDLRVTLNISEWVL